MFLLTVICKLQCFVQSSPHEGLRARFCSIASSAVVPLPDINGQSQTDRQTDRDIQLIVPRIDYLAKSQPSRGGEAK